MKKLYFLLLFLAVSTGCFAQKCGTMNHWEKLKAQDPNAETRKQELEEYTRSWIQNKSATGVNIITIPVALIFRITQTIHAVLMVMAKCI